jgi:hypothetical protein
MNGCLMLATIVVLAMAVCTIILFSGNDGAQGTPTAIGPTERSGYVICKQFLEKRLKAPSTADYPMLSETNRSLVGNIFTVTAFVDSQNSFGAMIRTNFYCQVEYVGNDNWKLLDLKTY